VNETKESSNILLVTDSLARPHKTLHKHLGNAKKKINSLIHSRKLKQTQIRPPLRLCVCSTIKEKSVPVCIYECGCESEWGSLVGKTILS